MMDPLCVMAGEHQDVDWSITVLKVDQICILWRGLNKIDKSCVKKSVNGFFFAGLGFFCFFQFFGHFVKHKRRNIFKGTEGQTLR